MAQRGVLGPWPGSLTHTAHVRAGASTSTESLRYRGPGSLLIGLIPSTWTPPVTSTSPSPSRVAHAHRAGCRAGEPPLPWRQRPLRRGAGLGQVRPYSLGLLVGRRRVISLHHTGLLGGFHEIPQGRLSTAPGPPQSPAAGAATVRTAQGPGAWRPGAGPGGRLGCPPGAEAAPAPQIPISGVL